MATLPITSLLDGTRRTLAEFERLAKDGGLDARELDVRITLRA